MKEAISYYSSPNLLRNGLVVKIQDNYISVSKGFLTLPNNETISIERDFKFKNKKEFKIIGLMTNLITKKGIVLMITDKNYDKLKYRLFERLAWRDPITQEWMVIKYVKTGSDLESISGGNTIKS